MKGSVLLAMSGGIDSSVAGQLLLDAGYDVVGVTFIMFDEAFEANNFRDYVNDAQIVASNLGIKHYTVDIRKDFKEQIINYFAGSYVSGITPNPCTLCNRVVKFKHLIDLADSLDFEYVATGHYAVMGYENGRYYVSQAADTWKDQTYFLWDLPQFYLKRTIFPLSKLQKTEVKDFAAKYGFTNLLNKRESYDVCFIRNSDYRHFIDNYIQDQNLSIVSGNFVTETGEILGKHQGISHYTVGQRKGLGLAMGEPYFVKKIDKIKNEVVIAPRKSLHSSSLIIKNFNAMKFQNLPSDRKFLTKIRFRGKGTMAKIINKGDFKEVFFDEPMFGVAPGQSAVFYEGNDLVGGGVIVQAT